MQAIITLRQGEVPEWRQISPAPLRFFAFLFVGMPFVFISLIYISALLMQIIADWTHERSLRFMASAFTGGAIALPHEPPHRTLTKVIAAVLGAAGVGMFGFLVAVLLDSGIVDPFMHACHLKLGNKQNVSKWERAGHICLSFLKVAFFVVSLYFIAALVFAWIMRLSEGWGWFAAIKTIVSVELGGGVVYREMGTPHTEHGTLLFMIVSCWAIGTAALMIATAAEAFSDQSRDFEEHLESSIVKVTSRANLEASARDSRIKEYGQKVGLGENEYRILSLFSVYVFGFLPVVLLLVMLFVASCMSTMTGWEWKNAFWTSLPAVTGGAAVLTPNTNPKLSYWGAFVMFFASSIGFLVLNLAMGIGAKFIGPFIASRPYLSEERGVRIAATALFIICWILIPILVFSLSLPLGILLALVEGWPFVDGFWWCVAVQCGGGMALTSATIEHETGMWVALVTVAWSIGISILSIGLSGATVVTPLMAAIGMNLKEELMPLLPKSAQVVAEAGAEGLRSVASGVASSFTRESSPRSRQSASP